MSKIVNGWVLDSFIAPGARLHQGDLIRFEDSKDPLRKAGIVVTADCDLDKKKHANLVTLVPVVSVKVLMERYLLPEDCERKRDQIEAKVFKSSNIDIGLEIEVRKALLLKQVAAGEITPADGALALAARFVLDDMESMSVENYLKIMQFSGSGVKKSADISQQIKSRGDVFILPDPTEFKVDEIAWVRHIWQESLSSIAVKTSEVVARPGERIARLDSPFRYRLTQLMAQVFSDIGLPEFSNSVDEKALEAFKIA